MKILILFDFVKSFFNLVFPQNGENRSQKAKRNIVLSTFFRGINLSVAYLTVPLAISYLSPSKYGLWVTLTSLIGWLTFFDVGLGHGLRNRLSESISAGDYNLAQKYVSTTYAIVLIIAISLFFLFYVSIAYVPWSSVLNVHEDTLSISYLQNIVLVLTFFFFVNFVLQIINTIVQAKQEPFLITVSEAAGKMLSLFSLVLLTQISSQNLLLLCLLFSLSSTVTLVVLTNYLFRRNDFRELKPKFFKVDFSLSKNILNLGFKFFLIRISAVLLYSTNNIIIAQLFGTAEVTPYNVLLTYFNPILLIFSIVISPFWSAFTEAWTNGDLIWIKTVVQKLIKFWILLVLLAAVMIIIAEPVFRIWVGDQVIVSFPLLFTVALLMLINSWNSIFSNFLNGVGKVKLQLYLSVFAAIINIPLTVVIGMELGLFGVILANLLVASLGMIIYPIQYKKIIMNRSSGIWAA